MNNNTLLSLSAATAAWFFALRMVNHFHIDITIIGVLREMFTIPFLLVLPLCLWFSLRNFRKEGYKTGKALWSIVLTLSALLLMVI